MTSRLIQDAIIRNLFRSSLFSGLLFIFSSGLNFGIVAILARVGGLDLLQNWATINMIVLWVLVLDFGLTNTLVKRSVNESIAEVFKTFLFLIILLYFFLLAFIIGVYFLTNTAAGENVNSNIFLYSATAGVLQLSGNWIFTFRIANHEQYWLSLKSAIRVLVLFALVSLYGFYTSNVTAIELAQYFFLSSLVEFMFSVWFTRKYWFESKCKIGISLLSERRNVLLMMREQTLAVTLARIQQPFWLSCLFLFAAPNSAGIFNSALRIPISIRSIFSEGLQSIIPGTVAFTSSGEISKIKYLVMRGVEIQILMLVPVYILIFPALDSIVVLWLGNELLLVSKISKILFVAFSFGALSAPYTMTLLATGNAKIVSVAVAVSLTMLLSLSVLNSLAYRGSVLNFAYVLTFSVIVQSITIIIWSEFRLKVLYKTLAGFDWMRVSCFYFFVIFISITVHMLLDETNYLNVGVLVAGSCLLTLLPSIYMMKVKLIHKEKNDGL